jgi:hypothetical protein
VKNVKLLYIDIKIKLVQYRNMRSIMTKQNRNKRRKSNAVIDHMKAGRMRFKRRLDVPMWHIDHLNKSIVVFTELLESLEEIRKGNSSRHADKCMYAQTALTRANGRFAIMGPQDPRSRGAELGEYTDQGYVDRHGHAELLARDDLNEEQNLSIYEGGQFPKG